MALEGISPYLTTGNTSNSTSNISGSGSSLSMDDFLKLLVAQLSNQDMYNTTDNTEFIAQMAQFSMVQALADLSEQSAVTNSVSLIGKGATVSNTDANGLKQTITGVVQGVTLYNGKAEVVIEGTAYPMSSVTEVYDAGLLGS